MGVDRMLPLAMSLTCSVYERRPVVFSTHASRRPTLRPRRLVHQDLLGRRQVHRPRSALAAQQHRILGPLVEAAPCPVALAVHGDGAVLLDDGAAQFALQRGAQRRQWRQHGFGVGVLRLQVGHDLGPLGLGIVVPHPVVLVDPVPVRAFDDERLACGHRRHRTGRGLGGDRRAGPQGAQQKPRGRDGQQRGGAKGSELRKKRLHASHRGAGTTGR
jgi:hypothetical protein